MDETRNASELAALVDGALEIPGAQETARLFLPELVTPRRRSVRALLLYGSCLWPTVRGHGSYPDFIVIADSLRAFHGSFGSAVLGALLPPSVYRLHSGGAYAKLSIVTTSQLRSQCAASAKDLHVAGRLSKRVSLLWTRDAESRTRFLGWRAENVKLFAFTVSAVMAGIAGALYVPQVGIINPSEFAPANSIEVVIWTAVGGRATVVGPIIGALMVNWGKSWFTGVLPEFWLFALGGLFILVTLFLPKGIVGTLVDGWYAMRTRHVSTVADKGVEPESFGKAEDLRAEAAE